MAQRAVLVLLCSLGLFQKGVPALIETQQTVMAAVGEEAQLHCQLMQEKDVLQVIWWKILPDGGENLASSHKYLGRKVNPDFIDKMEFRYAGLQNSSIVIKSVTEEDEGCYRCVFNTDPKRALTGTTCLRLYELHEPILHVRDSPEETVVSCSATGRPAPTVTLTVPHYNSTSVPNTNGTVTVTTTAVLPRLHHNSTQVNCTAHIPSGPQMEASARIPADKQSSDDVTLITSLSVVVPCAVCAVCAAAVIIIFLLIRKHQNRPSHREEEMKTPQKPTKDTHGVRTPLMKIMSEVRERMSSEKKEQKECSVKKSSPSIRRNLFLFE